MRALQKKLGAPGQITIDTILQAPGVMRPPEEAIAAERAWPAVECALESALDHLIKMREREGRHLAKDLIHRLKAIRQLLKEIRALHPPVATKLRAALTERSEKNSLPISNDD